MIQQLLTLVIATAETAVKCVKSHSQGGPALYPTSPGQAETRASAGAVLINMTSAARCGDYDNSPAALSGLTHGSQSPTRSNGIRLRSPNHNTGLQGFAAKKCLQQAGGLGLGFLSTPPRRQCIACLCVRCPRV